MSRVALDEPILAATTPASFAAGREVRVLIRGTEDEADVYSAEVGGSVVPQPLRTGATGLPLSGEPGEIGWVEEGSYTLVVLPRGTEKAQVLYWEAAKGGAGGGGGDATKAELAAHAADSTDIHGVEDFADLVTKVEVTAAINAHRLRDLADAVVTAEVGPGSLLEYYEEAWREVELGDEGDILTARKDGRLGWTEDVLRLTDFEAVPDEFYNDGKVVNGSTTFTSASANFTEADVGKVVLIGKGGPSSSQDHHTTIKEFKGPTEVVLNNAAQRSQEKCRFLISRAGPQTAAVQAAHDEAERRGGCAVYYNGVGFLVEQVVNKNRTRMFGRARRGTCLHQTHQANKPLVVTDYTENDSAGACGFQSMWLDGARARQSDVATTLSAKYTAGEGTIKLTDASKFLPVGMVIIGATRIHYTKKNGNTLEGLTAGLEGTVDATSESGTAVTQKSHCAIYAIRQPFNTGGTYEEAFDSHHTARELLLKNFRGDGLQNWAQSEVRLEDVWARNCDEYGFRPSFDTFISNSIADTCGRSGFYSLGASSGGSNNKAFFSGGVTAEAGHGFFFEGKAGFDNEGSKSWHGCNGQDNKAHGIYARNADLLNVTGSASTNSSSAKGTYVGLCLDGCRRSSFNLVCTDRETASNQQNALQLLSTSRKCTGNTIVIKHFRSGGTAVVGTAIKEGSDLSGGNDIRINGMGGTVSPNYAAEYTPDPYEATTHLVGTLTGNITINAPSNAHFGCQLTIVLTQDATGGRVVTWNAAFATGGLAVGRSAGTTTSATFIYNGSKWVHQSAAPSAGHRVISPDVVAFSPDWFIPAGTANVGVANNWLGTICRVPKSGELRDLMVYVHTQSGNVAVSAYSVATGGNNRSRKYTSGSVACPAQGWRIIGDPKLAVVEGELITLGFSCDNLTAAFGRYDNMPSASAGELPAAYVPEGAVRLATVKSASFPDAGETLVGPSSTTLEIIVVGRVA